MASVLRAKYHSKPFYTKNVTTIIDAITTNEIRNAQNCINSWICKEGSSGYQSRTMEEKLKTRNHTVYFVDPLELNLPLLDRMYKEMVDPSKKMKTLRNKINDAEGYLAVTPEYNRAPSGAIKNTLDYFLEEYYFKPSAIVSYSPGMFGGINAAEQLRLVFAELGAPSIPSSFPIPRLHKVFGEDGKLIDEAYDKRVSRFLDEFEWYIEAFKNQRAKGTPY